MTERHERRGEDLQRTEQPPHRRGVGPPEQPQDRHHNESGPGEPEHHRRSHAGEHLLPTVPQQYVRTGHPHGSAGEARHQSMALAGGQPKVGGEAAPEHHSQRRPRRDLQSTAGPLLYYRVDIHNVPADGRRHRCPGEHTNQVQDSGHGHRDDRSQSSGGDHGGHRVGGVRPAVDRLEGEYRREGEDQEAEGISQQVLSEKREAALPSFNKRSLRLGMLEDDRL